MQAPVNLEGTTRPCPLRRGAGDPCHGQNMAALAEQVASEGKMGRPTPQTKSVARVAWIEHAAVRPCQQRQSGPEEKNGAETIVEADTSLLGEAGSCWKEPGDQGQRPGNSSGTFAVPQRSCVKMLPCV